MHRSREEVFSRNTSILNFLPPKLPPLGSGGHEIYNFLSPYPVVLEKMLTPKTLDASIYLSLQAIIINVSPQNSNIER